MSTIAIRPQGDSVDIVVTVSAVRVGGAIARHQLLADSIRWPFSVRTMWNLQPKRMNEWYVMGGLQIGTIPDSGSCTSSFTHDLIPNTAATQMIHGPNPMQAISTTGHCVTAGSRWIQGSEPFDTMAMPVIAIELGTTTEVPTNVDCEISGVLYIGNCRFGDQAYAEVTAVQVSSLDDSIFKPRTMNPSTIIDSNPYRMSEPVRMEYFAEDAASSRWMIVGAKPPVMTDEVHKVGRTTGWTASHRGLYSALVGSAERDDPDCPGNIVGNRDNRPAPGFGFSFFECVSHADIVVDGGDSGSPVFIKANDIQDDLEVILVGVIYGYDSWGTMFVPIDRVYAELLGQGYDWSPDFLRPVPVLRETDVLEADQGRQTLRAIFDSDDFSSVLYYEAALFRSLDGNVSTEVQGVGHILISGSAPRAPFNLSATEKLGKFTVAVKACTDAARTNCGGYGSHGALSYLYLPPAPQNVKKAGTGRTYVDLRWESVPYTDGYELEYKKTSSSEWLDRQGAVFSPEARISPPLECGTSYEFRVRANGDGTNYGDEWGEWSQVVLARTASCDNPHSPSFGVSNYSFSVVEGASTDSLVGTVSATDTDATDSVSYSVIGGNDDGKFAIGWSNGQITVAGDLDRSITDSYSLTVQASDGRWGTDTVTVSIAVTDA